MVSTAAFHARVRGSLPGLGGLKETKMFLPHPRVKVSIVGSLRDREVACSASDRQGSDLESCVWRTVSSQSSNHPQEVLLAQFSLYVHKGGLKPDSFHFISSKKRSDPANTKHLYNICTTSSRWSNIVQMLYECFVFTGEEVDEDVGRSTAVGDDEDKKLYRREAQLSYHSKKEDTQAQHKTKM